MKLFRLFAGALLTTHFSFLPAAAWSPAYECHAERIGEQYVFFATATPKFPAADGRVPLSMLEVRLPGQFVWAIRADETETSLVHSVIYGQIPPGYSQHVPDSRQPERLRTGKVYDVTCEAGTGAFLVTAGGIEALAADDPRALVRPCNCPPRDSLLADLNRSSGVFIGQVERDEPFPAGKPGYKSYRAVTFSVSKWFKGATQAGAVVMNGPVGDGLDCTFDFEEGGEYLVFGREGPSTNAVAVDRCSRTALLDDTARREAFLVEKFTTGKNTAEQGAALDAHKDARQ